MITPDMVEPSLVDACPSFQGSAEQARYHETQEGEPELLLYILASEFVGHLTALNAAHKRDSFPAVFQLIERFHLEGEDYVEELATIGFLEDLQNRNLHPASSAPDDFLPYLGPVSRWWWDELMLFWSSKLPRGMGGSGRPHPADMGNSGRRIRPA